MRLYRHIRLGYRHRFPKATLAAMHPAFTYRDSELGHRVLIEKHRGEWIAVLFRRVRGPFGEDLDPVHEWRADTFAEISEAVESGAPGVSALVLVDA